jgi:recA bacterial DNA recombination protein
MQRRAHLEGLLRARKLDLTLIDGGMPEEGIRHVSSTGLPTLDQRLGGGWPRGETSEIAGAPSSGRTTVLVTTLAAATSRGEIVALVDALDRFDPPSASRAGVDLARLLWARGASPLSEGRRGNQTLTRVVDRALKACALILQAGGFGPGRFGPGRFGPGRFGPGRFGIVALDLADVPVAILKRLPFTTWLRLQRAVEGSDTVALLLVPEPIGRSARGITLRLAASPAWQGHSHRSRLLTGLTIEPQIIAARRLDANGRSTKNEVRTTKGEEKLA